MKSSPIQVTIGMDGEDIVSEEVATDSRHTLKVSVDQETADVYFEFSSRQALHDFARSLFHTAVYDDGDQKEFYPLILNGDALVVEGVRLTPGSSRFFVRYPRPIST
jgi:hypothetical protein